MRLVSDLERLGFTSLEAMVYVTLVRHGSLTAAAVSEIEGVPRTNLYPVLRSLMNKGVVLGGAGYGKRFRAIPPERALPDLVDAERARLEEQEMLAKRLSRELGDMAEDSTGIPPDVIEVIRNVRALSDTYQRLQQEVQRENLALVKAPILSSSEGNPVEEAMLARGVEVKAVYERAVLDHPRVGPYLEAWQRTGEQLRVYPGTLPMKYEVFDRMTCLLPLEVSGESSPLISAVISHPSLGATLHMLFEFLWDASEPLA